MTRQDRKQKEAIGQRAERTDSGAQADGSCIREETEGMERTDANNIHFVPQSHLSFGQQNMPGSPVKRGELRLGVVP